jgi:hypothetical protein
MNLLKAFVPKKKELDRDLERAERILYKAETFTVPDQKNINEYIKAFKVLLSKSRDLNNIFKIDKKIEQESANGLIYVVKLKKSKSKFSKLLIKVQRNESADPATYEYYVGLALNSLREMNVPNFGLVYGRFSCGFNPTGNKICDSSYRKKTYVLYEYITSLSDKTRTLYDYIKWEPNSDQKDVNLMNILVMLLISLQKAQDALEFTHYDLHLDNVLLVQLNAKYNFIYEYNGKKYSIMLDYFPFIIDFGRSHVNPSMVPERQTIYEMETQKYYKSFESYQKEIWKGVRFTTKDEIPIINHIKKKINDNRFLPSLKHVMEKNIELKEADITVDSIMQHFYKNKKGDISYGITPWKFNPYYDHCKLLNHVCDGVLKREPTNIVFNSLKKELEATFPFVIPGTYGVTKYYEFQKFGLKAPIDAVEYLYIDIEDTNGSNSSKSSDSSTLHFSQIGGNVYKCLQNKLSKKIKEKFS